MTYKIPKAWEKTYKFGVPFHKWYLFFTEFWGRRVPKLMWIHPQMYSCPRATQQENSTCLSSKFPVSDKSGIDFHTPVSGILCLCPCFVIQYLVSLLVLQSSRWGREWWLLYSIASWCHVFIPHGAFSWLQSVTVAFSSQTQFLMSPFTRFILARMYKIQELSRTSKRLFYCFQELKT